MQEFLPEFEHIYFYDEASYNNKIALWLCIESYIIAYISKIVNSYSKDITSSRLITP